MSGTVTLFLLEATAATEAANDSRDVLFCLLHSGLAQPYSRALVFYGVAVEAPKAARRIFGSSNKNGARGYYDGRRGHGLQTAWDREHRATTFAAMKTHIASTG
jgi:hypothetical protein